MSDLDTSFQKLLGRQPSDAEVQKLYRVRDALELKNNDALWLVLMALQHYETSYERMPKRIAVAAASVLADVKTTADSTMKASAENFKADMARAVAAVARDVARDTSRKQMWQWAGGALGVAFLTLALVSWGAFTKGSESGTADGYRLAQDEKAAAAWANTPQGQSAYRLSQLGMIDKLATCDSPGWKVEHGACIPYQAPDGHYYGWKIR